MAMKKHGHGWQLARELQARAPASRRIRAAEPREVTP